MNQLKSQRIRLLRQQMEESPEDPFPRYALAMELMERGVEEALMHLEYLRSHMPDYLPTYYQLAHLYVELDDPGNAAQIFEAGIALAQQQEAHKALHELKAAYQTFKFEYDLD
jgi:predicted RNA polymerase sigma factor